MGKIKITRRNRILYGILVLTMILNILAWSSRSFSDFYVASIFPIIVNIFARLTSIFSFSMGEIMLTVGVLLIAAAMILGVILLISQVMKHTFHIHSGRHILRHCRRFYKGLAWIAAVMALVMTCNCFILYHCSTLEEKYDISTREYTVGELARVRDHVVEQANALAKEMDRNAEGHVIYDKDMKAQAGVEMQRLSQEGYDQLSGYYPQPKGIMASGFLSQQYMMGYYFPFSMEANYNDIMNITKKPATMCHELAHLKGFIYEDEANFISFLACTGSDDKFFRYSGYLSVLSYLDDAFRESLGDDKAIYNSHVKISAQVNRDREFLHPETWKQVETKKIISTTTVKKASHIFLDTNQKINGIESGIASYTHVVGLLLDYYNGSVI